MHLRLRQQLRQVASNTLGDLEPDEIDDYLNQAQLLYLEKIIDPRNNKLGVGFEQSYQRFAQVGINPTVIVRELSASGPDTMKAALPTFMHMPTRLDVSTEKCAARYKQKQFRRAVVDFSIPHTVPDFSQFSIQIDSGTINIPNREKYLNPENAESFIRLLHGSHIDGFEFLWESDDDLYAPNCLIIKYLGTTGPESVTVSFSNSLNISTTFETISYNVADVSTDGVYRGCNIAQQEDISDMLIDPWQTTKHTRPLVEISGKYVIVHHNDKFVPKNIRIGYIPIPAPVSYNLNISSEMPERTHEQIVALARDLIREDMLNMQTPPESRS